MAFRKYLWLVVGLATIGFSVWLLYHELRGLSFADLKAGFAAIPLKGWLLSGGSTVVAYAALAGYDHIALLHLKRKVHWLFITVCSFTTYALSHNVGASVVSGAVVRYRAYTSRGLSVAEVGVLVALCSGTFVLGVILLAGLVLVVEPDILVRFADVLPMEFSRASGTVLLGVVALYVVGSFLKLRPFRIGPVSVVYPQPSIVARQLVIGPLELIGAAGIIYFALPEAGNPGFVVVLGIFLVSFSAALISHAPGGLGVLELVFVMGLPDMDPASVVVALLVFRLFYLIVPFIGALFVILLFERAQFLERPKE